MVGHKQYPINVPVIRLVYTLSLLQVSPCTQEMAGKNAAQFLVSNVNSWLRFCSQAIELQIGSVGKDLSSAPADTLPEVGTEKMGLLLFRVTLHDHVTPNPLSPFA